MMKVVLSFFFAVHTCQTICADIHFPIACLKTEPYYTLLQGCDDSLAMPIQKCFLPTQCKFSQIKFFNFIGFYLLLIN